MTAPGLSLFITVLNESRKELVGLRCSPSWSVLEGSRVTLTLTSCSWTLATLESETCFWSFLSCVCWTSFITTVLTFLDESPGNEEVVVQGQTREKLVFLEALV